jgi:mono/diheme cytochrome c family protein
MQRRVWVLSFLAVLGWGLAQNPPPLTQEERSQASHIYFDRCAGCHGVLRKGATGPALDPKKMAEKGLEYLKAVIFGGLPGGMPDWGRQGILSEKEVEISARFLLEEPPAPPIPSFDEVLKTWKVLVPVDKRPTRPQHNRNWQNFFGQVLRDLGQVAIKSPSAIAAILRVETPCRYISRTASTLGPLPQMNRHFPGHPLVALKDLGQESPLPVPGYPELGDLARRRDEVPGVVAVALSPTAWRALAVTGGQVRGHLRLKHLFYNGFHTLPDTPADLFLGQPLDLFPVHLPLRA